MAIKSIIVHPKGATHIQRLSTATYFMKIDNLFGEPAWFFHGGGSGWIPDTTSPAVMPCWTAPLR